jgi:hypothetical protein
VSGEKPTGAHDDRAPMRTSSGMGVFLGEGGGESANQVTGIHGGEAAGLVITNTSNTQKGKQARDPYIYRLI